MPCVLGKDSVTTFPGLTLFSKPGGTCMKDTSVYAPPNHSGTNKELNVVLWLHGFYVHDHKHLFHGDGVNVRQQVLGSNRDVVLIAPFLGHGYIGKDGKAAGNYSVGDLGVGKWGEKYLDGVLKALGQFRNPASPPVLDIKNLIIACHSGGGAGMRNLVGTLGKYQAKLKECWGFDCLYGVNVVPDDATFWYQRMTGKDARPLYIYYGPSTLKQSVKLDLIGRGMATPQGNKANPPGPRLSNLHVTIGHYEAFPIAGQMVNVSKTIGPLVDGLMNRPPPGSRPPAKPAKPKDGDYVKQAAANLAANFAFVDDIHYMIARAFLLSRLRNVAFS